MRLLNHVFIDKKIQLVNDPVHTKTVIIPLVMYHTKSALKNASPRGEYRADVIIRAANMGVVAEVRYFVDIHRYQMACRERNVVKIRDRVSGFVMNGARPIPEGDSVH
jgi:hypothetical protein